MAYKKSIGINVDDFDLCLERMFWVQAYDMTRNDI